MAEKKSGKLKVVPYYNKQEFLNVMEGLYSKDLLHMKWALRRIQVWESKTDVLEIGIDSTAGLVRALCYEMSYNEGEAGCNLKDLQMMYSLALIRFINVVSELKFLQKMSVRQAAAKIGIPEWIVNMRHDSAHFKLPPIWQLKEGVDFALNWLKEEYWLDYSSKISDYVREPPFEQSQVNSVLVGIQVKQCKLISKEGDERSKKKEIRPELNKLKEFLQQDEDLVFDALLAPGSHLSSRDSLATILKDPSYLEVQTEILPVEVLEMWRPVIKLIYSTGHIQKFTERLLQSHSDANPLHQKVASGWALRLMTDDEFSESERIFSIERKELLAYNWHHLLGACIEKCCPYTTILIQVIFKRMDPPLSMEEMDHISSLVAISIGALATPTPPKTDQIFTPDTTKQDLRIRSEESEPSIWHEAPADIDWSKIPLGHVFNGEDMLQYKKPSKRENSSTGVTNVGNNQNEGQNMETSQ